MSTIKRPVIHPVTGQVAGWVTLRLNLIGLSSAHVLCIAGTTIGLVGLNVLDYTPVLDIKPQSTYFDEPFRET